MESFLRHSHPFGEVCCEDELEQFQDHYDEYYFNEAPFNEKSIQDDNYIIVGRRGTGKSSLAHYFRFQKKLGKSHSIIVNQPSAYSGVLDKLAHQSGASAELSIPVLEKIWELVIWRSIFENLKSDDTSKDSTFFYENNKNNVASSVVRTILTEIINKFVSDGNVHVDRIEEYFAEESFTSTKEKVIKLASINPIIIAIDSLEKYDVKDKPLMWATAALVQIARKINRSAKKNNIHIKVFLTAEIYPHLRDEVIQNVGKYLIDPVYLHWRPKDLAKLVCWRYYKYLHDEELVPNENKIEVDWNDFKDVHQKVWVRYFGETIKNSCEITEKTFPYVLRHTQMRPRQLITICNEISKRSRAEYKFPFFSGRSVRDSIKKKDKSLAIELYNSYSKTYPNASKIASVLRGINLVFKVGELDRRARISASHWKSGEYSPDNFKRLVSELGIVGRVRYKDPKNKMIEADFEYFLEDDLELSHDEEYVIHPMFISKLAVKEISDQIVLPFPDHHTFHEIMD